MAWPGWCGRPTTCGWALATGWGQSANISFDAATWEIWTALLNGAELVVIPRETSLSSPDLASVLRQDRLTSLFLTTALFTKVSLRFRTPSGACGSCTSAVRTVTPSAARAVLAAGPPQRLLHAYGPAESTTYATWHPIHEVPASAATIPIGRPVANTSLYVMDGRQSFVAARIGGGAVHRRRGPGAGLLGAVRS